MLAGQEQALIDMKGRMLTALKVIVDAEHEINRVLDENYNKMPELVYEEVNAQVFCIDVSRITLARLIEKLDAELHDEERHTVDINGKEIDEMEL